MSLISKKATNTQVKKGSVYSPKKSRNNVFSQIDAIETGNKKIVIKKKSGFNSHEDCFRI